MKGLDMASVENAPGNESEMEEGEIVDDLDDLSDISSEEEYLLRQRLQVLENYNNVLERKKAKDSSFGPGLHNHAKEVLLDLSEISATDLDDNLPVIHKPGIAHKKLKDQKHLKPHHKPKKRKDLDPHNLGKPKDYKKKVHRKKKLELKIISESSEESEDEYRNKRRKLANAVALNRNNNDKSSLQDRLQKMLGGKPDDSLKDTINPATEYHQMMTVTVPRAKDASCSPIKPQEITQFLPTLTACDNSTLKQTENVTLLIDLCTDDDGSGGAVTLIEPCAVTMIEPCAVTMIEPSVDTVDSATKENSENKNKMALNDDSEDDLEQLRQHALKSKALKPKSEHKTVETVQTIEPEKPQVLSEDEDSDTAELRAICLKSALLKKAIEMKQKQKLRKRLSQSSFNLQDDLLDEYKELESRIENGNNTDIESVDMDMGSDIDEKGKEYSNDCMKDAVVEKIGNEDKNNIEHHPPKLVLRNDDELEEDEDLLRAKLLTSLSKNMPNLVDPNVIKPTEEVQKPKENAPPAPKIKVPEKRIIINLGESDSEGEHEATKNLTKMHMKLSEQKEFQQKLDIFLKSTRMEVEKKKLQDVIQSPVANPPEKFVAKTVNHLPKSEQIEYRNLVKKMAELEKIKEARQSTMNLVNQTQIKDTLKPRNVSVDSTRIVNLLEEQVAISRKRIAEESARMMQLKEEATKLTQKYKIVASELKNISTAITLNKKEQRTVQNRLSKVRLQHQRLLNSSLNKHSKINGKLNILNLNRPSNLQKENNPIKEEYKNPQILKTMKVSVVNDKVEEANAPNPRLSVQLNVTSNKKIVTSFPNSQGRVVDIDNPKDNLENANENNASLPLVEKGGGSKRSDEAVSTLDSRKERKKDFNDYESPLQSLQRANWEADPNAIMCPFEVGGNCKDPDCKYLHPKVPSQ